MVKNNIKAFLYHLVLVVLSTLYLIIFVSLGSHIGKILIHPFTRAILTVLWIAAYIFVGTKMSVRHRVKNDFQIGLLITFIGLIIWTISVFRTGFILKPVSEELAYLYIPLNIYLNPMLQICFLLGIEFNQIVRLVACFIPSFLIGIGIKFKRYKYIKRVHN
jgi:hypothetical protein